MQKLKNYHEISITNINATYHSFQSWNYSLIIERHILHKTTSEFERYFLNLQNLVQDF